MKTKICCIFGLAAFVIAPLFTMPARAANWVLAPDGSGQNLNTPGHKAKLTDADAPNNTLLVTIENAADHTAQDVRQLRNGILLEESDYLLPDI